MSRLVRKPVTLFSFAFVLLLVPVWSWARYVHAAPALVAAAASAPANDAGSEPPAPPVPPPHDFKVVLLRAGLSPEALAAAGVSSASISSTLSAAAQSLAGSPDALATADAAYATARVNSDRLERLIQSGKGHEQEVAAYQVAKAALTTAEVQRQAVLDGIFAAATANLSSTQRTALTNLRANSSWNLPREFLVVNRDQAEWVRLRDALANERISRKLGDEADAAAQAQLANWRAAPTVAAARTALDANLPQIRTNWNTAAGTD